MDMDISQAWDRNANSDWRSAVGTHPVATKKNKEARGSSKVGHLESKMVTF